MIFKQKAFSLIELSVVLIIISILLTGIVKVSGIINTAALVNARSITANSPVPKIDGLVTWYEATSNNSFSGPEKMIDGAQIEAWYNINPEIVVNNRDLHKLTKTATADTVYRTDGINRVPGVEFSGSLNGILRFDNYYDTANFEINPLSIIMVFKPYSNNSRVLFDNYDRQGLPRWVQINPENLHVFRGNAPTTNDGTNDDIYNNSNYILVANYGKDTDAILFLNDTSTAMAAPGAAYGGLEGLSLGGACIYYDGSKNAFHGIISEFIMYNKTLGLSDRKDIMRYLSKKYKISVKNL